MREYYGELSSCLEYSKDKNHKAIPWKGYTFSFELRNRTNYTLEIKKGNIYNSFATVGPRGKIKIQIDKYDNGEIFVSAKEDLSLECNFEMERGCMIKRNLVEHVKDKVYIAPIFKNGIITIVTCEDCGPNLGAKPEYEIKPLEHPARMLKICNYTYYDLIISTQNRVIQKIEAMKEKDVKPTSKYVGIPSNAVLYIDTVSEEIAWKDRYNIYEDAILRVNGCCLKLVGDCYDKMVSVVGPALLEPYIRHLYVSLGKTLKYDGNINIWCNTIDYRLD